MLPLLFDSVLKFTFHFPSPVVFILTSSLIIVSFFVIFFIVFIHCQLKSKAKIRNRKVHFVVAFIER